MSSPKVAHFHLKMIPEIPGKLLQREDERKLQDIVSKLLQTNPRRFPGAQPISFARTHIKDLLEENYFVSEKADGVRVLIFTRIHNNAEESYLIDRKNNYYKLNFGLPNPGLKS